MSDAPPTPTAPSTLDENKLLVEFERKNIPAQYREYYATKRNNFFASVQGFNEMWDYYLRLDAVWMRSFADLHVARDPNRMFPLLLYFNAHAKIRIAMELAFTGCMSEARSILRDAVEFVAHAHWMLTDPELQKTWLSKNDNEDALNAFKGAFEHSKKDQVFKGLDELHKTWGELSETGSHANINATVDRFVQVTDDENIEFKLNYTGVHNQQLWGMMIFSMLLTCSTMESVFFSDHEDRLKLDNELMQMRADCDRVKEQLRQAVIVRYRLEPPGGVHVAPKPIIYRP